MMNIKGIFAVSFIAMVAMVAGAHTSNAVAAIASQGYVDQQVGLVEEKIPAAITVDSALNSTSTNPVQNKVINTALAGKQATLSAAQLNAVNSGITSTKVSTYDGYNEKITAAQNAADDAAAAAATAQSTASGKLSSISGETTGTGNVVTSVSASGSTVSATKGITAEETKNKVKSVRAVASATDTAYPSEKAVATALAGKVATAQGSGNENKAVITNSSGNITTGTISSGMIANDAVTSAKLASGAVTSAKIADGTITNVDIATNAAIEASKVDGLAKVATSGLYKDLDDKPTIPTVNNATLTIQKNGATVDTFTANASANKTINITVPTKTSQLTNDSNFITAEQLPDEYTLPVATEDTLGGVKSGGDITVSSTGAVTVNSATRADSATNAKNAVRAENDAGGNDIQSTYAKKSDIPTASDILTTTTVTSSGTGAVLTGVSVADGKVTLQKGNVQIPSGGQNATSYVSIWVE